jgi:hypothetical protein
MDSNNVPIKKLKEKFAVLLPLSSIANLTTGNKTRLFSITNKRIIYFLMFVMMFTITEIGRNFYRPFIYTNDIFDFYIADTIGNFTGAIAIIFFELMLINPTYKAGLIILGGVTVGLIGYEFAQYFSPRSILDWRDMIATLIAGLISLGIYKLLSYKFKEEIS